MSLCATNASKVDAALLDDGVAYTLVSGNTSGGHQPSCYPLEARQRPHRPDRDEYGRQRKLPRVSVLASLTKRGLRAAARSLAIDHANRYSDECRGAQQLPNADASRRPTSRAPCGWDTTVFLDLSR